MAMKHVKHTHYSMAIWKQSTGVHTTSGLLPKYNKVCKSYKQVIGSLKEIFLDELYYWFLGHLELLHVTLTE